MKGDELKNLLHGTIFIAITLYLRSLIAVLVFVTNLVYNIYSFCSLVVRYRWNKDLIILLWNYVSRQSRFLQLDLLHVIIFRFFGSVHQRGQGDTRLVMGSILSRIRPNEINYSCLDENCYLLPSDISCAGDKEACLGILVNEHYPRYNMTGGLRPVTNKPHQVQPTEHGSSIKRRTKNSRWRKRNKSVSVPLPLNSDVQPSNNKSSIFEPRKFPDELDQKSMCKNDPKIIGIHGPLNEIDSALVITTLATATTSTDHCKGGFTGSEVYSMEKSTETQFDLVREPESVVSSSPSANDRKNLVAHSDFAERDNTVSEWGSAELFSNRGLENIPQEGRNENIEIEKEAGLEVGAKVAWVMECPNNDNSIFAQGTVQSLYLDNGLWFACVDFEAPQDLENLHCERTENGWRVLRVDELLSAEATVCSQGFEFTDNTRDQHHQGDCATSTGHENELAAAQMLDENDNEGALSLEDSIASACVDVTNMKEACGKKKGIQGRANSCYLDSTLFALFYCTQIFDGPLLAPRDMDDDFVKGTKTCLRNSVVNRLRTTKFVSAEIMMKFRKRIVHFNPRLIGSFMDAEHFVFILLEKTLKSEHFFTYNSDMSDYMHQIFVPPTNYYYKMSTTQKLFERSMEYNGELKFKEIPNPALIIQLPRTNGKLVDFDWIVPSLQLDVSNTVNRWEAEPRRCCVCDETATVTCSLCDKDAVAFCELCVVGQEANMSVIHDLEHPFTPLTIIMAPTQIKMDLIAVICVASYHYTAYVKCGQDLLSPWLHFDSNGPEIRQMFDVSKILLDTEKQVNAGEYYNRFPPRMCKRIFTDCHLCIYKPPKPVQSL